MELNWSVKNSKIVWQGRFPVIEDLLESDYDGREHLYTYLGIDSTAVGVVALDSRQRLLLVNEYRHPVGRVVKDIPMGTAERGENLREAAARELQEETGWAAQSLQYIGGLYPVPALTSLRFEFYFSQDLIEGEPSPDESEVLEVEWMDLELVVEKLTSGDLAHGGLPMALPMALQKGVLKPPSHKV